jgi:hypothetical protein
MAQYNNTTTSKTERLDSSGKVFETRNTRTTTSTQSQKVLTRSEKADKTLGILGQVEMIGITIITLAIAPVITSNIAQTSYLETMYPNYNQPFENNEVADPIGHFDYIQYGDQAVSNIVGTLQALSWFGGFAQAGWNVLMDVVNIFSGDIDTSVNPGSFVSTFGETRMYELSQLYFTTTDYYGKSLTVYRELTPSEITFLQTANTSLFNDVERNTFMTSLYYIAYQDPYDEYGSWQWFWTMPSVVQYAIGGI